MPLLLALIATLLLAPTAQAASPEQRAYGKAVRAYDRATRNVLAEPGVVAALRARQDAAAPCADDARALGRAAPSVDGSGPGLAALAWTDTYRFHALETAYARVAEEQRRHVAALDALALRSRTLRRGRSAMRAVAQGLTRLVRAVPDDLCGPTRAWRQDGFAEDAFPAALAAPARRQGDVEGPRAKDDREARLHAAARAARVPRFVLRRYAAFGLPDTTFAFEGDRVYDAYRAGIFEGESQGG